MRHLRASFCAGVPSSATVASRPASSTSTSAPALPTTTSSSSEAVIISFRKSKGKVMPDEDVLFEEEEEEDRAFAARRGEKKIPEGIIEDEDEGIDDFDDFDGFDGEHDANDVDFDVSKEDDSEEERKRIVRVKSPMKKSLDLKHQCTKCSMKFKTRARLTNHIQRCSYCDKCKRFLDIRHQATCKGKVVKSPQFRCPVCFKFLTKNAIERHVRGVHGIQKWRLKDQPKNSQAEVTEIVAGPANEQLQALKSDRDHLKKRLSEIETEQRRVCHNFELEKEALLKALEAKEDEILKQEDGGRAAQPQVQGQQVQQVIDNVEVEDSPDNIINRALAEAGVSATALYDLVGTLDQADIQFIEGELDLGNVEVVNCDIEVIDELLGADVALG